MEVVQFLELDNGIVQITMKDEEHRNSFSAKLIEGLYQCFAAIAKNEDYKVVILTGYGNYFATGGTQEELLRIQTGEIKFNDLDFFKIALDCKIPVIAAMQGHGIGGGLILGLYADLIVLAEESIYATNFMNYGFTPGLGATLIVPEKLGNVLGQEMMYTARNYRGKELAERGVSFPVVPKTEVLNYALNLAHQIADKPRLSLVTLKEHLTLSIREKLPQWIDKEIAMHEITFCQPEVVNRIEKNFGQTLKLKGTGNREQGTGISLERENLIFSSAIYQNTKLEIPSSDRPFQLKLSNYGLLKNLILQPTKRRPPQFNEVEIEVKAVALNFRDLLNVLGLLQEYNENKLGITNVEKLTFGFECVGKIVSVGSDVRDWKVGDEVMAIAIHDGFSSFITCDRNCLVPKPKSLSMVDAVTIPIPFFTAYHGLYNLANLQPGERVLIHSAAGGTGQAAIQLAKLRNAEIFATASPHKWDFLKQQGIKYVMNSRTLEFAEEIMEITQGSGVDVIFNSLTQGDYIKKNLEILGDRGRYIEIGKAGIWSKNRVFEVRSDIQYFPFDLGEEFADNNKLLTQIWNDLALKINNNLLKPLPKKVFAIENVIDAFRYMKLSQHIGRIVVTMPEVTGNRRGKESEKIDNSEEILSKLQLGEISLDYAEKLLLEKEIDRDEQQDKIEESESTIIDDLDRNSEDILALLEAGEIAVDCAEKLLSDIILKPRIVPEIKPSAFCLLPSAFQGESLVKQTTSVQNQDIAVVGISCRYPGANNLHEFWENLKNGIDSITEVPEGRWLEKNWYHPNLEHPNTSYSKWGGFLSEIDRFDPAFFQIAPAEAKFIEPQQRIFLEEAYYAFEDAGYTIDSLKGKQCGVFVGAASSDYNKLLSLSGLDTNRQVLTGNILSMLPARIAYFLDLRGPVIAVDTACSSSLVAIHQACVSIQTGESEMAVAGGINLLLTPSLQILSSQFQMLSPQGRCQTFDLDADGTVWSEGCGVVVLKKYDLAVKDGDRIYGVIKGSGVNYDGTTNGITAPSGNSQVRLQKAIYEKFDINPETIGYVEAHGTATPLGDPIEVEALNTVFSQYTNKKQYCALGSVKTNIGHPAAAAGIAGFIKTILCLKNKQLVPSLYFDRANPQIDFENSPFYVNTELKDWTSVGANNPSPLQRRAIVNSFGFSGTNAHIVLEEFRSQESGVRSQETGDRRQETGDRSQEIGVRSQEAEEKGTIANLQSKIYHLKSYLLTISAKSEQALEDLVQKYQKFFQQNPDVSLADVCFTANSGRTHFKNRLSIVASSKEELVEKLASWQAETTTGICSGQLLDNFEPPKIVFMFTGQGSQYINMGKELYQTEPLFRKVLEECDRILYSELDYSLLKILYPDTKDETTLSKLDRTGYTQPAIFAIEYALFKLWQSWGIKPDLVMGHSVGEYVAACVAGVFSLEDALKLIAHRGRLMEQLPEIGKMVAVMASEDRVSPLIANYRDRVSIAAINGKTNVVISGEGEVVDAIALSLKSEGIKTTQLQVSHAFHSPLMKPILNEFRSIAQQINYASPQISLISNVTGQEADDNIATVDYWVNHITQPINFLKSINFLKEKDYQIFLEIGAKPILSGILIQEYSASNKTIVYLPSLNPRMGEWQQMLSSLGQLYVKGININWLNFEQNYQRQKISLPHYPFQKERYWIDTEKIVEQKYYFPGNKIVHPLLGHKINLAGDREQYYFQSCLDKKQYSYLNHYQIFDDLLFPSIGYLEIALVAGISIFNSNNLIIKNIVIERELIISETNSNIIQTNLIPVVQSSGYKLEIFTSEQREKDDSPTWSLLCSANIQENDNQSNSEQENLFINLENYLIDCSQKIDITKHYQQYQEIGINYGVTFQQIQQIWRGENQAIAKIQLSEELELEAVDYQLHPTLLNAALQIIEYALPPTNIKQIILPVKIAKFQLYKHPSLSICVIVERLVSEENLVVELKITNEQGQIISTIEGLQVKQVNPQSLFENNNETITDLLYEIEWKQKPHFPKYLPANYLLTPNKVKEELQTSLAKLVNQFDSYQYQKFQNQVEKLTIDYIQEALIELNWSFKPGDSFSLQEASEHLSIIPSKIRLFQRILQILAEEKIICFKENINAYEQIEEIKKINPKQKYQTLLNDYPQETATLNLLDTCASQLSQVLQGKIDPVQLLFPDGNLSSATQLYQDSPLARVMNTLVEKVINQAIRKLPKSRGIRILEIGAGTGGTTSYILPHLNPQQVEYVFTDIGSLFISKAQEKFRDYSFVSYKSLDIETDPINQGFEAHTYDIIIAANVLHATTNLEKTLSNVQKLLVPEGMLVLLEGTTPSRWADLVFGLLEGWWKFQDFELRSHYPLLNISQWQQLLSKNNFTQVVALPQEELSELFSQQTVIVAQAGRIVKEEKFFEAKHWLIFGDRKGVARQLANQLSSLGQVCTLVFAGENYQQIDAREFTVNPELITDYAKLFATEIINLSDSLEILHLWSLDIPKVQQLTPENLESSSRLGCGSILLTIQALLKEKSRLWLFTQDAQPVAGINDAIAGLAQSPLWGMGRVISLEHPQLWGGMIDLESNNLIETAVNPLIEEILAPDGEDHIAFRDEQRYVARLLNSKEREKSASFAYKSDATYLITGGLGFLGLKFAQYIAKRGAGQLVLIGRTKLPPLEEGNREQGIETKAKIAAIKTLEKNGTQVTVIAADVTDPVQMSAIIKQINTKEKPLKGIIHAAGIGSGLLIKDIDSETLTSVLKAKTVGTWILHQLTKDLDLDCFISFSSAGSVWGAKNQADYDGANHFLDVFAHYRRSIGLSALTVNWGSLGVGGIVSEDSYVQWMKKIGLEELKPEQGFLALDFLIETNAIQSVVAKVDWQKFKNIYNLQQTRSLLNEVDNKLEKVKDILPQNKPKILQQLEKTSFSDRQQTLITYIQEIVAKLLGIKDSTILSPEQGFTELGMDSLAAVELRNTLQRDLDCSLPTTLAFEFPNIAKLAKYISSEILGWKEQNQEASTDLQENEPKESDFLSSVQQLTEEEVESKIAQELAELNKLLEEN